MYQPAEVRLEYACLKPLAPVLLFILERHDRLQIKWLDDASGSPDLLKETKMRCLIVYSSKHGQTEKIAKRIAEAMRSAMADVEVQPADKPIQRSDLEQYEVIVFGSPIYFAGHSKPIGRHVSENLTILNHKVSAFYSVSLSASGDEKQRDDANRCVDAFLRETGWTPTARAIFAGKLAYREYGWIIRMLMKWISWREGGDTDTSQNYEYTDWNAVDAFALDLLAIASIDKSDRVRLRSPKRLGRAAIESLP